MSGLDSSDGSRKEPRQPSICLVGNASSSHLVVYWRYLQQRGHDVEVLGWGRPTEQEMRFVSLETRLRFSRLPLGLLTLGERQLRACLALIKGRYDVVSLQFVTAYAIAVASCWRGPLHASFWGSDVHRLAQQPGYIRRGVARLLRKADAIQAVSQHMARELVSLGAPEDRIDVFQYGIDTERFRPPDDSSVRDANLIVSTRALEDFYRIDLLIRAFARVAQVNAEARLVLAGGGAAEQGLRKLVLELGIGERVEFAGQLRPDEMVELLQRASVWVSLPPTDGTPLSLLEAMSCGAYPVVADYPSLREWIEPGDGDCIVDVNPASVVTAVEDALKQARSGAHVSINREQVLARGDRVKNLRRFEISLMGLADPGPDALRGSPR